MENNNINIEQLIIRYFTGDANHSETSFVEKWRSESEDNFLLFREYEKIWKNAGEIKPFYNINVDNEWEKMAPKIDFAGEVKFESKKRSIPYMRIAAVFVVLVVALVVGNYFLSGTDGTQQLHVAEGPKEITLADGSKITLNKNSILEYPDNFDDDIRSVQIEGEAYFEVEKDQDKPFVVKAEDINIQVLGTSFYVNTDENNHIVVIVKEGQVEVYRDNEDERLKVGPNEKATFSKENEDFDKEEIQENDNYLSWKTKKIVFEDTKLKKVVKVLSKTYDCEIVLDKSIENLTWDITLENKSLEAALKLLQSTLQDDLEVIKSENKIEIKGVDLE